MGQQPSTPTASSPDTSGVLRRTQTRGRKTQGRVQMLVPHHSSLAWGILRGSVGTLITTAMASAPSWLLVLLWLGKTPISFQTLPLPWEEDLL